MLSDLTAATSGVVINELTCEVKGYQLESHSNTTLWSTGEHPTKQRRRTITRPGCGS